MVPRRWRRQRCATTVSSVRWAARLTAQVRMSRDAFCVRFTVLIGMVHGAYGVLGKVGGLLNGAAVGEKFDGVCATDTPQEIKLKVGLLSSE